MRPVIFQLITIIFVCLLLTNCTKENPILETSITTVTTEIQTGKSRNNDNSTIADFKEFIEKEMQAQHIPALSVLIFEEDEILYEGCFGKSNVEKRTPLQNDHLFLLASVSKVVTATALLQLYEKDHFDLDDNINDYLDFEVRVPNFNKDITFRMLLTHTSGIGDGAALDDQYYYGEDSPVALADFMEDYLTPEGEFYDEEDNFYGFAPGEEHEYSNMGSALIGVLVEQISGMDFSKYCQQYIFNPLGMSHTAWHLAQINNIIVQPYDYINGRNEMVEHYTFTDYPNGGLRSTASDMFRFISAFVQRGQSTNYQLLKATTIHEMTTLQIPNLSEEMGLHLFIEDGLWGHDGGEQGVATSMAFSLDTKIGVIILSNQGEADLADLLVEAYGVGKEL